MDTDDPEGHRGSSIHHAGDEIPMHPRSLLVLNHPIDTVREQGDSART